jgi:hypothetical protein
VITAAAAGTVTLATALSVVAITAPPSASPASGTADAAFITAVSPSPQASLTAQAKATQAHAFEQQITAEKAGAAAAKATAAKAAAAKTAAAKAAAAARAAAVKAAAAKAVAEQHAQVATVTEPSVTEPSGSPEQIAQQMLGKFGWSASQFSCLQPLWEHESGWSVTAENPSSGAYGIAQALPASQMASAGSDWQTNAATQIKWGLTYIQGRYGSPCGAWAHEESVGWY